MTFAMKLAGIVLATLLLTCCALRMGEPYDASKVDQFIPGKTTVEEVIAAMGEPQEHRNDVDGTIELLYFYFIASGDEAEKQKSQGTTIHFDGYGKYLRAETGGLGKNSPCRRSGKPPATPVPDTCSGWFSVVAERLNFHK
jgi:hypothetical protein